MGSFQGIVTFGQFEIKILMLTFFKQTYRLYFKATALSTLGQQGLKKHTIQNHFYQSAKI